MRASSGERILRPTLSHGPNNLKGSRKVQFAAGVIGISAAEQQYDVPTSENGAMRPMHAPSCMDAAFLLEVRNMAKLGGLHTEPLLYASTSHLGLLSFKQARRRRCSFLAAISRCQPDCCTHFHASLVLMQARPNRLLPQDERLSDQAERLIERVMVLDARVPGCSIVYCSSGYAAHFHCREQHDMLGRKVFEVGS